MSSDAPRITPEDLERKICNRQWHVFSGTTVTVCCLTLQNGYHVIGMSACVSPENFNRELGERIAYEDALSKMWALEGYLLKERIYQEGDLVPAFQFANPATVNSLQFSLAQHTATMSCDGFHEPGECKAAPVELAASGTQFIAEQDPRNTTS